MIAYLLVALVGVAQLGDTFLPSRDFILTKSGAVGLLPPISVCDYEPETVAWSDDGNRLLIVRKDSKLSETRLLQILSSSQGQRSVLIFDLKTRKTREVLSFPESHGAASDIAWFGNDRNFFLITRTGTKDSPVGDITCRLLIGDAFSNRINLVHTGQPGEFISFCPSPKGNFGAMLVSRPTTTTLSCWGKFMLADGRHGAAIETPENASFRFRDEAYWSADAETVVLPYLVSKPSAQVRFVPTDPSSGKQVANPNSRFKKEFKEDEFGIWEVKEKRYAEDQSVEKSSLWLSSLQRGSRSRSLIVGDGKGASISPAKNAVFYNSGGIGVVRPLISTSREEFAKLLSAEERMRLTAELQECIKVFKEWVLEENMEFPTPQEWEPKAKSWAMSRPEIVGFVYTFKGGQIPVGKQSQTVFGYKLGETGRATCYMDGRVVWNPN